MGGFAGAFWADKETHNKLMEARTLEKRIPCSCEYGCVNEKARSELPAMLPKEIINIFEQAPRRIFQSDECRKPPSRGFAFRRFQRQKQPQIALPFNPRV